MGANAGLPIKLAGRFRSLLQDDVRHLTRESSDAQACRIDDLNALDVRERNLLELVDRAARFVGDSLAVDDHIFRGLTEAPLGGVGRANAKARHLHEHVVRGLRGKPLKIGWTVDPLANDWCGYRRRCESRVRGRACSLREGWNGERASAQEDDTQ